MAAFLSLFEDAVTACPDAQAITDARESISYRQLRSRAIGWSARLAEEGVHRGDVVAVATGRTVASIVVILGAWRLGAGCMPYPSDTPAARLAQMFDQARPAVAVADSPGWVEGLCCR